MRHKLFIRKYFCFTLLALTAAMNSLLAVAGSSSIASHVYWGDTHLHTSNSFDVYLFNTPTSTPDTAYRFAKGLPVISPTTGTRWQLQTPLDFLVIADHAEALGSIPALFDGNPLFAESPTGKILLDVAGKQDDDGLLRVYQELARAGSGLKSEYGIDPRMLVRDLHAGTKRQGAWETTMDAAERHNDPGKFTAFIGWEWTSQPGGGNLHRVVFTSRDKSVAEQFLPFSSLESQDPEKLWAWLEQTSATTGADFVSIPHNSNVSDGKMFALKRLNGKSMDVDYARTRMKWEPVIEVTQIKGDSETHPLLSPNDEFADYESYSFILTPDGRTPDPTEADYARSALKNGLKLGQELGVNPFKFGLIGSTDAHTGMSAVEEKNFAGKGQHDALPAQRPRPTGLGSALGWDMGAAGLVAAWAPENTRREIFDAFTRKEVYATTGTRIQLRFFGGYNFSRSDQRKRDIAAVGYKKGVAMGGDLDQPPRRKSPGFLIQALKDPNGANLDRIQVVKGWLDETNQSHEKVFDVALSNGRRDGSDAVGNTVDLSTGAYTNDIGDAQLTVVWKDPEFDASRPAFYYVRVLEIPTPRYSLYDAIALGIEPEETGRPATIQERAYSSPIWYIPSTKK